MPSVTTATQLRDMSDKGSEKKTASVTILARDATLRDAFAGQVVVGLLELQEGVDERAAYAYRQADAMLKAREATT